MLSSGNKFREHNSMAPQPQSFVSIRKIIGAPNISLRLCGCHGCYPLLIVLAFHMDSMWSWITESKCRVLSLSQSFVLSILRGPHVNSVWSDGDHQSRCPRGSEFDNERSIYASLLLEIETLMSSRQNTVRHSLTNYARIEGITVVRSGPAKTDDLCNKRCKPDSDWLVQSLPAKKSNTREDRHHAKQ